MGEWIKWWKDKTFVAVLATAFSAVIAAYVLARYFTWGWMAALAIGVVGGLAMRQMIKRRIDGNEK